MIRQRKLKFSAIQKRHTEDIDESEIESRRPTKAAACLAWTLLTKIL